LNYGQGDQGDGDTNGGVEAVGPVLDNDVDGGQLEANERELSHNELTVSVQSKLENNEKAYIPSEGHGERFLDISVGISDETTIDGKQGSDFNQTVGSRPDGEGPNGNTDNETEGTGFRQRSTNGDEKSSADSCLSANPSCRPAGMTYLQKWR
jgi:hypothetical protein